MLSSLVSDGRQQGEEAWHEWRRAGVGASDAGAICGLSPWQSALGVWLEKTGRAPKPTRVGEPEWLRWGRRLERVMTEEFEESRALAVDFSGSWHERPGTTWQHATLDGLVFEHGDFEREGLPLAVLELKNTSWRSPLRWEDGIPKLYRVQVQHQLMVTGLEAAFLAVLHDGSRYRVHEIPRDEEAIAALEEIEEDFWHHVRTDEPPPVAGDKATETAVRGAYATPESGASVVLDERSCAYAQAYVRAQRAQKAIDVTLTQLRTQLMLALGEAEVGVDARGESLLTWKGYEVQSVDLDGLREHYPAIVEEHTRRVPTRRFVVKATAVPDEEVASE